MAADPRKEPRIEPAEGCPEVIASLDLGKPGLLEASAGTGKTYAMEHLVLRILLETPDIELPQILILTFTDKAAGDLKEKIRGRLATRLAQGGLPARSRERLRRAHLEFDRASIHTIHGFCRRVLKRYAFETHALFNQEVQKNVPEAMEEALREAMRSAWLGDGGPGAAEALRQRAASLNFGARTDWMNRTIRLAQEFNPARGDRLLPEYSAARVEAARREMSEALSAAAALAPGLQAGREAEHPFAARYATEKPGGKATLKKRMAILAFALRAAAAPGDPGERARRLLDETRDEGLRAWEKDGFAALAEGIDWPGLKAFLDCLDRIKRAEADLIREEGHLAHLPRRETILDLRERARSALREQGLITYDSMIEDVCLALRDDPERIGLLRREYRYCLVDEFQDTDPLQWEIFRRAFLESGGANPLYLIGDPKQAIYSFRGGDVYTYMDARRSLFALSREGKAQGRGLDTNYRSSSAMVAAYNAAFLHSAWFHAHPVDPADTAWRLPDVADALGYLPVKAGDLPAQSAQDGVHGGKPIILKDFGAGAPKRDEARRRIGRWIASEILGLMGDPGLLMIPDKARGTLRPVEWGDLCVLVRKTKEMEYLERVLGEAGIPVESAKRKGLCRSDAASQFLAVLESLQAPADAGRHARALLTRFFRAEGDPAPERPPATPHSLFEGWLALAARRRWQRLFHSMLYGSGMLYREALRPDADRAIMDFLHLGENLVREAIAGNLDLAGLVQRLKDMRMAAAGADEDADLRREASDGGKVTLMTMHVSKGLEFPVVFLASWSGAPAARSYLKDREDLSTGFRLDTQDPEAKEKARSQAEEENRRLYYVALTRARYKLYAPILSPKVGKSDTGPMGGFVAEALRTAAAARPDLYHRAPDEDYALPPRALPAASATASPSAIATASAVPAVIENPVSDALAGYPSSDPLAGVDLVRRRRRLASYSLLVRHAHGLSAEALEGRFDKDEAPAAEASLAAAETAAPEMAEELPRGKEIGNLLHEILEEIDFSAVGSAAAPGDLLAPGTARDLFEARMLEHRLEARWLPHVAALIWNVLNARLPDPAGGESFRLAEVGERRPDLEFLFPYPARPGGAGPDGYVWGFIDLVYRFRGRYYLLDWKSNHLPAYGPAELARSMAESRYDVQYKLYALAIDRWLGSLIPGYDFDAHFGGVHYLYLRGLRPDADPAASAAPGVFSLRPTAAQVRGEYSADLAALLSGAGGRVSAADLFPGEAA